MNKREAATFDRIRRKHVCVIREIADKWDAERDARIAKNPRFKLAKLGREIAEVRAFAASYDF